MQYIPPERDPGIFEVNLLNNGIQLFHRQGDQTFGLPITACSVVVMAGGRDDPTGKEGSAHFFEHMPFRGTKRFPSLHDLTFDIENNGGYINAFTSDEATGYEITMPSSMTEEGISRIADMLLNPLLRPSDIDTERQVILEELRNKLANVNFFARQELYKGLLGEHPLVHAIIGNEAALTNIAKKDLTKFHSRYYNASNIAIFFAGSYEREKLVALCNRYFGGIEAKEPTKRNIFVQNAREKQKEKIITPKRYNRSLYLAGRLLPPTDLRETLMIKLFRDMLVRGMDSPLYQEIRDKRGLAYNLGLSHNRYQDVGVLMFSVSTQFQHMDEVHKVFWEQVAEILQNKSRFEEVKHAIKQSLLHRESSVSGLVDSAIDIFLDYNRIVPLDEYIQTLEGIALEEVGDYLRDYLVADEFLTLRVNCDNN